MGLTTYTEIEKHVLNTVLMEPTFERWASLCSLMSEGIYAAAEHHDKNLPRCGWLHICARYLAIVPKRENRDRGLAPNEFFGNEVDSYCKVFKPVIRSLRHYIQTTYPNFDPKTGKWSRAGKEDEDENPFPFFISGYLSQEADDDILTFDILFEIIPEDCGDVVRWDLMFHKNIARITDDYDAELECGEFAGDVGEDEIREIVAYMGEAEKGAVSQSELDILAHMLVTSYEATKEMHESILEDRGVGRFTSDDFDRSSLFHASIIQPALVVFQPHFIKEIERCGIKIQQYRTSICDMIALTNDVKEAWRTFFRELKRQFHGNAAVVDAESAGLRLVEHYALKVGSEGGSLHVPAEEINSEYVAFVEKLEQVAKVVAQNDYARKIEKKGVQDVQNSNDKRNYHFNGCGTVQIISDQSSGVQATGSVSKSGKKNWIWSTIGTVIAALIIALIKMQLGVDE